MRGWTLALGLAVGVAAASACDDDSLQPDDTSGAGGAVVSSTGTGRLGAGGDSTTTSSSTDAAGGEAELPETFIVRGVVTDGTSPLQGASVLQGGGEVLQLTGADGAFEIEMTTALPGTPTLVAGKIGYRADGQEVYALPTEPFELVLRAAEPPDNEGYFFGEPGNGDPEHDNSTAYCGHCHTTFVATFQGSRHQNATKDPWVQDLYAGVASGRTDEDACEDAGGILRAGKAPGSEADRIDRCYVGDGVLADLNGCGAAGDPSCDDPDLEADERPTDFGLCADCHAAGMDGPAGGRDLLDATGVAFEQGNHCDACHHVRDIDLDAPPGTGGRLVMQRPRERVSDAPSAQLRQVMFGPLLDVPNGFMGGSFQPKFMEATFCAGCHEQRQAALLTGASLDEERWPDGLPTHSTFTEWSESDYAPEAPCQTCHMPVIDGMFNSVDVSGPEFADTAGGFGRPPERNRSHAFVGALEGAPRMLDRALVMTVDTAFGAEPGALEVSVSLMNYGAGHAVPTGEPMRSLLLVLQVDACGLPTRAIAGSSISDSGGALVSGRVGDEIDFDGSWPAGAARAQPGQRLRVTRPTGDFVDYPGVGWFADPSLTAEEKGIPEMLSIADALVVDTAGDTIVTDPELDLVDGDLLWLGETPALGEGDASAAIAGMPGQDFARITVDPEGRRRVPHYRAVDLASDNRIPPGEEVVSMHAFAVDEACDDITVTATLLYRRAPLELARERGWDDVEHVVTSVTQNVSTP
jgi:hypothetical protein